MPSGRLPCLAACDGKAVMRNIVNALLLRRGSVLLARRSPHRKAYPGLWSFPGGHVDAGETLEQALIRELREEVAVVPLAYRVVARIADPGVPCVAYHMFAVSAWEGRPRIIDEEHTDLRWFTLDEAEALPDLAIAAYRPLFGALRPAG